MTSKNTFTATIVFVDDEEFILNMAKRLFSGKFNVITYKSPTQLQNDLGHLNPALFVLDWLMPEMDGLSLCRQIRENHQFDLVPIIFFSGIEPSEQNIIDSLDAGALSFIPKPSAPGFLISQINALVSNYFKSVFYTKQRETILSVARHDMANFMTGVVSGVEMIKMKMSYSPFPNEMTDEIDVILSSAEKLKKILEDIPLLLTNSSEELKEFNFEPVPVPMIIHDAMNFISNSGIEALSDHICDNIVTCNRNILSRAIYYLSRYIYDNLTSTKEKIILKAESDPEFIKFSLIAANFHDSSFKQNIYFTSTTMNFTEKGILPITYVEKALNLHESILEMENNEISTTLFFKLNTTAG
ncbi:MAG: hypothetical protein CVV64_17450 [Candidatus Wallbacteria bacterium HGW-Wallbacteria-1]|jgi:CheY-like chemotaxis protein|uniref:Response regulatory domain-containing protein n=1 Tax=Candidatus Wallbacteria bacterium HGW-Wallbacteria-1 TaxID=2013854 RepID=A0A2N1PK33_9BACT|nr:MAG: hypothetical protein CVV64_17450 [Candidatus Wallbacteria bacterium HGW-Wallbacteria-1]